MPLKRILKLNEENLKKQEELIVANRYATREIKEKMTIKAEKSDDDSQQQGTSSSRMSTRNQPTTANQMNINTVKKRANMDASEPVDKRECRIPNIPGMYILSWISILESSTQIK